MKIMHLCLYGPYTDHFSYQENILPRYHKSFGHDVVVVARNLCFDYEGKEMETDTGSYFDEYGIKVIRVKYREIFINRLTERFADVPMEEILKTEKPDLIFIHDAHRTSLSYLKVADYVRHHESCALLGDIHNDFYNSHVEEEKKKSPIRKLYNHLINGYFKKHVISKYRKIYCVAQSCYDYAKDYLKINPDQLELLPLGFDTYLIEQKDKALIRRNFREKYGFKENDIVVAHGGKLDKKKRSIELIDSLKRLKSENIKLVVFGGIVEEYKNEMNKRLEECADWIVYLGPLKQDEYYDVFLSCDIAVFPGGQSSLWQEAIGCGLPLIVYHLDGKTDYLNRCGNVVFVESQDEEGIYPVLRDTLNKNELSLLKNAANNASAFFSYREEANKIIEDSKH